MNSFLILFLSLFFSQLVIAESIQLPAVEVNQDVLGGDILLINMKEYLVISGSESTALKNELGIENKKNFTKDIIMTEPIDQLIAYYMPSESRPVTMKIIQRYSDILLKLSKKETLN